MAATAFRRRAHVPVNEAQSDSRDHAKTGEDTEERLVWIRQTRDRGFVTKIRRSLNERWLGEDTEGERPECAGKDPAPFRGALIGGLIRPV
jgi:hypothetical protein